VLDLAIDGGTVVTPRGRSAANVYVLDGRIAAVTDARLEARERVDAGGLLVLPGMVDAHVHLMDPGATEREDFPTGTAAAARAGVTTVIEHTHARPVLTAEDLSEKVRYLDTRARVDFALAAHVLPGRVAHMEDVWRAGAAYLKAFTCTTHGIPGFGPVDLAALFEEVARLDAVCLVHCEDEALTAEAERLLRAAGRDDGGVVPEWRNRAAELAALVTVAALAKRTGARVVAAHVSHADAVAALAGRTLVETCPQYLTLFESEVVEHEGFRKFTPPARARTQAELDALWADVAGGRVDYVSSDHAPATVAQKTDGTIWDVPFGLPGLDTTMGILLDGAAAGRISYERLVEVYADRPARLYGLAAKGRLEPAADADIVLVDREARWTVRDEDVVSRAGWSPYAGRELTGRVLRTYARGELAAVEGEVVAEAGAGRFLARVR
jgi:dihydroorotase